MTRSEPTSTRAVSRAVVLALAVLLALTASRCGAAKSSVDELAEYFGRSVPETRSILGTSDNAAESQASRWLEAIKRYQESEAKETCSLLYELSGGPGTPKNRADLEELLKVASAWSGQSQEAQTLQGELEVTLAQNVQTVGLAGAIVAFDEFIC